ncbi:serine/threonine protein kinase [Streptomyces sp. 1114.5]|uniref:serine/threonine-protein kinase n=1 Tax=unclassified Streptomyces TaxID=2593676 RepID=UPI000BC9C9D1|nr:MULTISPECIES: serine/threonine-protein kinase [unclassified Streptomyces]RKT15919.1 serine/threonine protein kinase [Streptomyces sp. 1114.5]SOB82093.1 Serine/threonine protein kinase [Streptomyces sp. 1331.2]
MEEGDVLGGRFRLEERLGRGGFGVVWRATDQEMRRQVAVKVLLAEHATDREAVARFVREARTAGGLSNPHIVTVYDYGRTAAGSGEIPYLVMELVRGRALSEVLRGGPPDHAKALRWMRHVCKALDAAHRSGIVHRDIKPENVMIADEGERAKVLDFGIARLVTQTVRLTSTGNVVGTVPYLAPECWSGGTVDGRADLYALGVMLYEVCTGGRPFRAASVAEYIHKHLDEVPARVRSKDPALADLVAALLAKEPGDRPADAAEVLERLRAVRPGMLGPGDPTAEQLRRRADRAWQYGAAGEPAQAVEILAALVPEFARICGPADPRTLRTCHDLALWLARDGSPGAAVALLDELTQAPGADRQARADARRDLGHWQREVARLGPGRPRALSLAALLDVGAQAG